MSRPALPPPGPEAERDAAGVATDGPRALARPLAGPLGWVLGLGALAALLRTVHWQLTAVLFNDGPLFLEVADAVRRGAWSEALAHEYHPLYPAATGLLARLLGADGVEGLEACAVAVSVFGGVLTAVFAYLWLRDAFGEAAGRVGGTIAALHPWAVRFGGDVQSDGLYVGLFVAGVWAAWRLWRTPPRVADALLAGVAAGLAYLVRPEGGGVGVLAAAGLLRQLAPAAQVRLGRDVRLGHEVRLGAPVSARTGRVLAAGAALALGALLAMAPYVAFISYEQGSLILSRKKAIATLFGGVGAHGPRAPARQDPGSPEAAFVDPPAPDAGSGYAQAFGDLVLTGIDALRYELVLCLLLGLWSVRGRPGPRAWFVLLGVALWGSVLFGLRAHVGYLSTRHVLPVALLGLGWVALGVPVLGRGLARALAALRPARPLPATLGFALACALVAGLLLGKGMRPYRQKDTAERRAAEWLAERNLQRLPVAAVKRRVGYYARAPFVDLRLAHPERLPEFVRERGVGWIVVDEDEQPQLEAMMARASDAIEPVREFEGRGDRIFVYRTARARGAAGVP